MAEQCQCYTVGVDIGTGGVRVCIVDQEGVLVAVATHATQTWQSRTECYEQSTSDIWQSVCQCMRKVLSDSGIDSGAVAAIVFDATCSLAVFDCATNTPVSISSSETSNLIDQDEDNHNIVLWMHRAAAREAGSINTTRNPLLRHLGGAISPLMALSKVLWLKNNMPTERYQRCRFFDLQDAVAFIATGNNQIECGARCQSSARRGFGVDGTIKGWDTQLLREVGLEDLVDNADERIGGVCKHGNLPDIGVPIGTLCEKAATETGLSTNVVVGTGVIDSYAGWVGTVGTSRGAMPPNTDVSPTKRLAIVAGTSACHVLVSDSTEFVQGLWGPYQDFLLPTSFTFAGGQNAVGRLLQHIIETHPAYRETQAKATTHGQTIFEFLNDHLSQMQRTKQAPNITHLGRHIFFYGDFWGNRTPIADASMAGSIAGLTGDTDTDNMAIMYYSAMEFLALQTRHIINTMLEEGHTIHSIFVSGSVCQNQIFIKLLATACNLPVVIPLYSNNAVCYGSALLAAYALSLARGDNDNTTATKSGLWSIMTRMSKPGKEVSPDQDGYARRLLDVKYTIFLEQADRQRAFRRMIDDVPR